MAPKLKSTVKDLEYNKFNEAGQVIVAMGNEEGGSISVQNPLPTDGDSIYVKDLDVSNCDNGNFSGIITDYFDSLKTVNTDITANNPKIIKLWFKRTIYSHSIGFGCDDITSGFGTSITIKLLGSGESVRFERTFTDIDPNSFIAEFGPKVFNGAIIEFNTAAEVCLSNITIQKSREVSSTLSGTDPDGDTQQVNVTMDGDLSISDNSSGLSIAAGNVTDTTFVHKFGAAPDFDSSDGSVTVWDGADDEDIAEMQYNYSTTAAIDSISTSSAVGTQNMLLQGLDADYNLVTQAATLNGQNRVALTIPLIRLFRMKNNDSTDNLGSVYAYENTPLTGGVPIDTSLVRCIVQPGNNQTLMAVYTIPAGYTGYMRDWYASTAGANKDSNYVIELRAREQGKVFQLKHVASIQDGGTSYIKHDYTEPEKFGEMVDIEMRVKMLVNTTKASISAGFDIVLVKN